jgi:hypothetical protein
MSLEAIAYMTTRAANDMEWLTPYTAEKLGISIKMTEHGEDLGDIYFSSSRNILSALWIHAPARRNANSCP